MMPLPRGTDIESFAVKDRFPVDEESITIIPNRTSCGSIRSSAA